MPRYYCDYCDTYLTHDSPSVRKQHNAGYKHKANVRLYYQQFEEQQTQSLIDQRIKEHLGQAAAFQQVGAAYNQHLMAQRPRMPILPTPGMPMGQLPNAHMIRPPVLPRPPPGGPGYVQPNMPPMMVPPGAPGLPQMNGLPRPPSLSVPPSATGSVLPAAPGSSGTPTSGFAPPLAPLPAYQPNSAGLPPPSGAFDNFNAPPKAPDTDN